MGRPSKLSEEEWAEFDRRRLDGESRRSLCREYGISEASAREREEKIGRSPTVQNVAAMLVNADAALRALPVSAQVTAQNLAEKLKSISSSLASAAELGAKTSHRLHSLANSEVAKVDDAAPMASLENLRNVGVLTKLANESAHVALNLLAASKDRVAKAEEEERQAGATAQPLRPQLTREQWLKTHGLA